MKFGKHIQKKQLEIPEYAASFVDYKALKKLIKELKNSPVPRANASRDGRPQLDPQAALQANKAPFFFRLDRELDKVNTFYQVKEEEAKVRLRSLSDKQKSMRMRTPVIARTSSQYITLEQGLHEFARDLGKLQQFIEINATAFSKILKKWDKTSKSQTKELYLSRAIEIQPCFNHDVISTLTDEAQSLLLDCAAWAEGEDTIYESSLPNSRSLPTPRLEQDETENDLIDALNRGDMLSLQSLISRLENAVNPGERLTKAFLSAVSSAPEQALKLVLETNLVDLHRQDEINDRNCLHKSAMAGRHTLLKIALAADVDPSQVDAYGRIPLHYACMNGHVDLIQDLYEARPATLEIQDLNNFTPLIHSIVSGRLDCVEKLLGYSASVNPDPSRLTDHIPLNLACQHGDVRIIELLLQKNPNIRADAEGLYPQHLVARFGRSPQLLLMLRDYGVDLDQPDKLYLWTPLIHAASEGRIQCLQQLLECGVNVNYKDEKDLPAQYYATWEGHLECMAMLASAMKLAKPAKRSGGLAPMAMDIQQSLPQTSLDHDPELIPDLSLPPPILPTRRYGHNFLESKTTVVISFEEGQQSAVAFYDASKYPAARLTVAPKSTDIYSRSIMLPIQEESRSVSFEMDNLASFSVDFDVYPTFGKKVIAKGSVPSKVFQSKVSASGHHILALMDPRLRSVGQISFRYHVIKPFSGTPLEMTTFTTYWRAISQFESKPSNFITGSSLSGDHVRLYVQLSRDGIPILFPYWNIPAGAAELPVIGRTYEQFIQFGSALAGPDHENMLRSTLQSSDLSTIHHALSTAYTSLENALTLLPHNVNVELHVLYPSDEDEAEHRLGPTMNINDFVDNLLKVVFQHLRQMREESGGSTRSIVFTSYNKDVCAAINWKQPNYPVLFCNDLGAPSKSTSLDSTAPSSSGRTALSIKEAVRIAKSNNFMGLVIRSEVLDMVPALIESIKVEGLLLVADKSGEGDNASASYKNTAAPIRQGIQEGVDGVLVQEGVLRFVENVEM